MVVDLRSVLPPEAGELGLQALHKLGIGVFGEVSGVHLAVAVSGTHVVDGEIVYAPTIVDAVQSIGDVDELSVYRYLRIYARLALRDFLGEVFDFPVAVKLDEAVEVLLFDDSPVDVDKRRALL